MNNITTIIIVVVILLWYYRCNDTETFSTLKRECNDIDNRCYQVVKKFPENTHAEASRILAHLNIFSIKLMRHLRHKYLWEQQGSAYRYNLVEFLLHNYNPGAIIENNPPTSDYTSYVEDKGKVFALCLREKISGNHNFISMHLLEFVLMHEIAHLTAESMGHGNEYWNNFIILLQEADEINIHKPVDYAKYPVVYCSLLVDYNPFFDKKKCSTLFEY
jgi:hypothetical protein